MDSTTVSPEPPELTKPRQGRTATVVLRILVPVAIVAAGSVVCLFALIVALVTRPLLALLVPLLLVPFVWFAVLARRSAEEATEARERDPGRARRVYAVGLLATVVAAALVGWWSYQSFGLLDVAELEELPPNRLSSAKLSPGGEWEARSYLDDDQETEYVVVSQRDGSAEPRIVYIGDPAGIYWRGESTLLVIEARDGRRHRLDAATASYRRSSGHWLDFFPVPVIGVVVVGVALTAVFASGPSRRGA